ncbi:MAG: hypothetical protein P4L58_03880, partial [Candidatus Pacebacteria bacterium]|nr:hypothetical protein [Candidatus Paceibacterota bacterium]
MIAEKKRVVLFLDTLEKLSASEDLIGEIVRSIHPNVLMVFALRRDKAPDWDRAGFNLTIHAIFEELRPLKDESAVEMVGRYLDAGGGEICLEEKEVKKLLRITRKFPLWTVIVLDMLIRKEISLEDFMAIKEKSTEKIVDYLTREMSNNHILETAAIVHRITPSALSALLGKEDARTEFEELCGMPFLFDRSGGKGISLHDSVRSALCENLRYHCRSRYRQLNLRACDYFQNESESFEGKEWEWFQLESLYHKVCADEKSGMELFIIEAEKAVKYANVDYLQTLLNGMNDYPLELPSSILWKRYYVSILKEFFGVLIYFEEIKKTYEDILKKTKQDPLTGSLKFLRAKTLLRLVRIFSIDRPSYVNNETMERKRLLLEECDRIFPGDDWEWHEVAIRKIKFNASFRDTYKELRKVMDSCKQRGDGYAISVVCQWIKGLLGTHGRWREFLKVESEVANMPSVRKDYQFLAKTYADWQLVRVWMGRYSEAEEILRDKVGMRPNGSRKYAGNDVYVDYPAAIYSQGRYSEVIPMLDAAEKKYGKIKFERRGVLMHKGILFLYQGKTKKAKKCLLESAKIHDLNADNIRGVNAAYASHELKYYLALCCLHNKDWEEAEKKFGNYLEALCFDDFRMYFRCGSLIGVACSCGKTKTKSEEDILCLLNDAEKIAKKYEYNDHLASLWVIRGNFYLEKERWEDAESAYRNALLFALRYNRFLLDEMISGPSRRGVFIFSIVPSCLRCGNKGKEILE